MGNSPVSKTIPFTRFESIFDSIQVG